MYTDRFLNTFRTGRQADRLINEARRRYRQLLPTARPGPQHHNILGLFGPVELLELTLAHRWPLGPEDLRHVTGSRPSPDTSSAPHGPVAEEGR